MKKLIYSVVILLIVSLVNSIEGFAFITDDILPETQGIIDGNRAGANFQSCSDEIQLEWQGQEDEILSQYYELLTQDAEGAYQYFDNSSLGLDRNTGFPYNFVRIKDGYVKRQPYTSVTDIGMHLASIAGAYNISQTNKRDALYSIEEILDTLDKVETYKTEVNGKECEYYFNYYDFNSLSNNNKFVSSVDSAWLAAGLITAREAFPELENRINPILDKMDFSIFYDDDANLMMSGCSYDEDSGYYPVLNSETRMISYIAIGKGDLSDKESEQLWDSMSRGKNEWMGIEVVPSWGGSAFEHGMPALFVNETNLSPQGLGVNLLKAMTYQRLQAAEKGYPVWGESPSTDGNYDYDEFGTKAGQTAGGRGYPSHGIITPHASHLGLQVMPEAVAENLEKMKKIYPDSFTDEKGYVDAVDVENDNVLTKYLALDQGMSYLSLANALGEDILKELFTGSEEGQRIAEFVSNEEFFTAQELKDEVSRSIDNARDNLNKGKWRIAEVLLDHAEILNDTLGLNENMAAVGDLRNKVGTQKQQELESLYQSGNEVFDQENYSEAVDLFVKAAAIDTEYKDVLSKLYEARELLKQGETQTDSNITSFISFDEGKVGDHVIDCGAWYGSPNKVIEKISSSDEVLKVDYDVPDYGGIWFKLVGLDKIDNYSNIVLSLRAPDNINELKLELKSGGRAYTYILNEGVTSNWQEFRIPLGRDGFNINNPNFIPDEFVITIEGWKLPYSQREGTFYVDDIYLENK